MAKRPPVWTFSSSLELLPCSLHCVTWCVPNEFSLHGACSPYRSSMYPAMHFWPGKHCWPTIAVKETRLLKELLSNAFVGTYFRTVLFYAYLLILWLTTLTDAGRALEGLKQILFDLCNVFYSNQCNIRYWIYAKSLKRSFERKSVYTTFYVLKKFQPLFKCFKL